MSTRILKPTPGYAAPAGFVQDPIVAVPYDADTPEGEIVDKDIQWVHPCTKSTFNKPTVYSDPDACGNLYYNKGNVSTTINKKLDCGLVVIFQGSLNVTHAKEMTEAEFGEFVDLLKSEFWNKTSQDNTLPV